MSIDPALCIAGAVGVVGLSAAGSAIGIGKAACATIGAWKKCYAQNKPAPYTLFTFVGAPLTQTLYGMILMTMLLSVAKNPIPGAGIAAVILAFTAGAGICASAAFQGQAAAAASDAQAETGKGLPNYLAAIGVIETVAIFVMVFAILCIMPLSAPDAAAEAIDAAAGAAAPAVEAVAEAVETAAEAVPAP